MIDQLTDRLNEMGEQQRQQQQEIEQLKNPPTPTQGNLFDKHHAYNLALQHSLTFNVPTTHICEVWSLTHQSHCDGIN